MTPEARCRPKTVGLRSALPPVRRVRTFCMSGDSVDSKEFPKSNAGVSSGDFCFVPRTDGRIALFIYLYPQGRSRSYFFGALAADVLDTPDPELIPCRVQLAEQALLHIKCFQENAMPIAGNILDRIDARVLRAIHAEAHSSGVGAVHLVWGYRTIINRANAISAQ